MLQVTPQTKGNGNELNPSWDELNGESANDICESGNWLLGKIRLELKLFFSRSGHKNSFFMDFSIHTPKTTIHTEK